MSILMKLIVNADAEVRYLTSGELEQIKSFVMSGDRRLRLAQSLTQSRERNRFAISANYKLTVSCLPRKLANKLRPSGNN